MKGLVVEKDIISEVERNDEFKNHILTLKSAFPHMLQNSWIVGAEDSTLMALHELLVNDSTALANLAGFPSFREAVEPRLWEVVIVSLKKHLPMDDVTKVLHSLATADIAEWSKLRFQAKFEDLETCIVLGRTVVACL